jgi:hypothetical protein
MVLRGEIEKPFRFLVLNADPGMEDSRTEDTVGTKRERCAAMGIDIITAQGPDLYHDLVNSRFDGSTRIDNPPYWTRDANGKRGKLKQKCTNYYKIAPMDRALRHYMSRKHGVKWNTTHLRPGLVEKWIGFAHDEWHRCSESDVGYIRFRFPLIERKMDKAQCVGWYLKRGLKVPVRSVCNACFANGLNHFREMHAHRPADWAQAVAVDNALETWKGRITEEEVFVSASLVRLRDLPAMNFGAEDEDMAEHHCNSGVCFL